jgi:hypothetical protein
MSKYLVFKSDPASGKSNAPGSPEDVACDIACFIEMDGNPKAAFIAFPADSPQATLEAIRCAPRFSVALDQKKIDVWMNDARSILKKIYDIEDCIEDSYSDIMSALDELEYEIKYCLAFRNIDLVSEINVWNAFEDIEKPTDHDLSRYVSEYFEIERLDG